VDSPLDSSPKSVRAICDAGDQITGGGNFVGGIGGLHVTASLPSYSFDGTGREAWEVRADEDVPTTVTWRASAFAICLHTNRSRVSC
jgi:hypothetical protein